MRIGMTCYPSHGGSGVVASELGRQLARRGHSVHFIAYDLPFRLARFEERVFFHEVEVPAYPLFKHPPYLLALANKMVEVSRNESLDILHVHYAIPHATSAVLARQILETVGDGRAPAVITTLHGTDITLVGSEPSFADLVLFSLRESDGVTAVSKALRRQTLAKFAAAGDIRPIYNFIDPADYGPWAEGRARPRTAPPACSGSRSEPEPATRGRGDDEGDACGGAGEGDGDAGRGGAGEGDGDAGRSGAGGGMGQVLACRRCLAHQGEAIVTHISNFRPVKRADLVVTVFAAACREVPARLVLIGDGPDLPKARKEAARLGVADRVVYLGQQERVEELLASSDAFLLPSLEESFGLSALEAMAAGTPVVATRVGGLPEVVGEGEGGFLYEVDDVAGLTKGLRALLLDPAARAAAGARARTRAFRLFSAETIVPQYEDYYRAVLDGRRARGRTKRGVAR